MDPMTALSLASSIITFIDFSWSLVSGAKKLYDSGQTATDENVRIGKIVSDLREYSFGLQTGGLGSSKHEIALRALANDCQDLSKKLLDILTKLKGNKNSKWRSLKTQWTSMRKSDEILSINVQLCEYRAQMNVRLLALLGEQQSTVKSQLDKIQSDAQRQASASAVDMQKLRNELTTFLDALRQKDESAEDMSSEDEEDTEGGLQQQDPLFEPLDELRTKFAQLKVTVENTRKVTRILGHLHYKYIFDREDDIEEAAVSTFQWIVARDSEFAEYLASWENHVKATLKPEQTLPSGVVSYMDNIRRTRDQFQHWLSHGNSIFHISGKAGSGKSTLMKFIFKDGRTRQYLEEWANSKELVLASFYFWRSSNQRLMLTMDGLYRSILFQVLRKLPDLIPRLFPDQWESMSSVSGDNSFENDLFTLSKIKKAFDALMKVPLQSEDFAFCFFIDGLDELEGDQYKHNDVARKLRDWSISSNFKICASSRPEIEISDAHRLHLHEITARDIYLYSRLKFETAEEFPHLRDIFLELVGIIVNHAEGVFVWAQFVTQRLIIEAGLGSDHERIRRTLYSMPPQLETLYEQMLERRSKDSRTSLDQREVNYILLLVLTNPFSDPMNALCLCWLDAGETPRLPPEDYHYSDEDVLERLEIIRKQLQYATSGILTLVDTNPCLYVSKRIQFFHRTARDYVAARISAYKAKFPKFDSLRIHSCLRLMEMAFVNPWNISWADGLGPYGAELLTLPDASGTGRRYQQSYSNMKFYECVWFHHLKKCGEMQHIVGDAHHLYIPRYLNEQASFLHFAAYYGQIDFIQRQILAGKHIAEDNVVDDVWPEPPCFERARPNLLLTACLGGGGPDLCTKLLENGYSGNSLVYVYPMFMPQVGTYASVWHIILFRVWYYFRREEDGTQVFELVEQFLRSGCCGEAVFLQTDMHEEEGVVPDTMHYTTLKQVVLFSHPPNQQRLLELLPQQPTQDLSEDLLKCITQRFPVIFPSGRIGNKNLKFREDPNHLIMYAIATSMGVSEAYVECRFCRLW